MLRKINLKRAAIIAVVLLAVIQLVPVKRDNPPGGTMTAIPADVHAVLKQSCFDCHSNETTWPWYSHVAPMSWLVTHDVHEGRHKLNFSTWDQLDPRRQDSIRLAIWDEVSGGDMPLWYYLPAHPQAKLTPEDRAVLQAWASGNNTIHQP